MTDPGGAGEAAPPPSPGAPPAVDRTADDVAREPENPSADPGAPEASDPETAEAPDPETDAVPDGPPVGRRRRSRSLRRPEGAPVPATDRVPTEPPTSRLPVPSGADDVDPDDGVDPDAPTERLDIPSPAGPPRRRRLLLAAAAAVALLVVLALLVVPSPEPDPASTAAGLPPVAAGPAPAADPAPAVPPVCAPVTLVTADGDPGSPLRDPVRDVGPLRPRLVPLEVPRPAAPADPGAWSRVVRSSLEATAQRCPATTFLVYAWSDGAAATTDALATMEAGASPTVPRIAGVALVGNPARDPSRRTLPPTTRGAGVTPSPPGSLRALAAGTVEICAPADPVCAATAPAGPGALAGLRRSPAHRDYDRVATGVGDRTVPAWLADAARQAVDTVAPTAAPGAPPRGLAGGLFAPAPGPSAVGGALTALGLPVADPPGLIWRAARGARLGFGTFKRNSYDEQSGSPSLVPGVRGGPALRFSVASGGQRSEMQPRKPDPREGQTQYIGYYGVLGRDYPIGNRDFQIIMQWHHPGPDGSPPLTVEASNSELRLTGGERRPFIASIAPVRPGDVLDLVLRVTFSSDPSQASVSVWKDGQLVVNGVRPPEGTLYAGDDSAYMKLGMYRSRDAAGTATVFVNDVLVGTTLEAVSPVRRGFAAPR